MTPFSAEMVQAQTKAMKPFVPSRFNELLHQVQNFCAIFALIFGSKSCIIESLAFVMNEIDKNEWLFVMSLQSSSEFALGFFFMINSVVHQFFRAVSSQLIGSEATMILKKLANLMHRVTAFRFAAPLIPLTLCRLISPDGSSSSQQKRESSTVSLGAHKKKTVKNEWLSIWWAKRTGENFSLFSARKAHELLLSGVPVLEVPHSWVMLIKMPTHFITCSTDWRCFCSGVGLRQELV